MTMQIIQATNEEKITLLRENSYFSSVGLEALHALAQNTSRQDYARGEVLFWQGDACTGLYILHSGSVKLFKLSPKGRELIVRVLYEGATFNEVPVFDHGTNVVNAAALEDSRVWLVEAEAIRACLRTNSEMAEAVILNLSNNLRTLVTTVEELSFYQVTSRLARLISRLQPELLIEQRITQDQLAAQLGTVREVVARSLRDLERSGAIHVSRRQIQILDREILSAWADEPKE